MSSRLLKILIFIALATGGFAIGTTEFATMSLLPLIQHTFTISEATASHMVSMYALGVVIGAPIITVLGARIPRKPLLIALMAVFALANGLSAVAPSYTWLLVFRFISGLPHGAYFGVAALVAASIVNPNQRTQAVGYILLGLTFATIAGVPLVTWLASLVGWRAGYWMVTTLAIAAGLLILAVAPHQPVDEQAHPLRELTALARPNVWLTLSIGAIGLGGAFAVYTYLTTILDDITHMSTALVPMVLAAFGVGMTLGNIIVPYFADRWQMPTAAVMLTLIAVSMLGFPLASHNSVAIFIVIFCIGFGTALETILQARLMDVAGDAQNLAAALNHVAFNLANALGPFLAGIAIASGFGVEVAAGYVGAGLALLGLVMWGCTVCFDRQTGHVPNAA